MYILFLIFLSISIFYVLFYLVLEIILFGFFLGLYQLDLFTAFLWLAESVVIFVSFMLLFYIASFDNVNSVNVNVFIMRNFVVVVIIFMGLYNLILPSEVEFFLPIELQISLVWDDFYEALNNDIINDLFGIMLSFYVLNSFEFLIFGLLLLIVTVICVNLNKVLQTKKLNNYPNFLNLFNYFTDSVKFFFGRRQNLVNQELQTSATRVFGRK